MARKRHTAEEIVSKLRHVDVLIAKGWQAAGCDGGTVIRRTNNPSVSATNMRF